MEEPGPAVDPEIPVVGQAAAACSQRCGHRVPSGPANESAAAMNGSTQSPAAHGPLVSFPFRLSCGGRTVAGFSEASTLAAELDRKSDCAGASFPATPAGRAVITLRRGLVTDPSFLSWIRPSHAPGEQQTKSPPALRDLILTVIGETGEAVATHRLPESSVCSQMAGLACTAGTGAAAAEMLRLSYRPTEPDAAP